MTIGELARRFSLSRSTLLYYDSIGLLKPSDRSRSNYRLYTVHEADRLQLICLYRQMGLSMGAIREILDSAQSRVRSILEQRLTALGKEITSLREQQHAIIHMLGDRTLHERNPVLDKEGWIALLRAAGLDDEGMVKWHKGFEQFSPWLHQEFLEGLGISTEEIELIRQMSRT
jgi:DNA-binding transcriptional MerR regulator